MTRQEFSRSILVPAASLLVLGLAVVGGCKARDDFSGLRDVRPEDEVMAPPPFDFAQMRALIETQKIKSIDDLLPRLPEEFLGNAILMSDSRSTQEATPWAPRAIIRNNATTFVLSFNGDPNQSGYRNLETYEYDAAAGKFTFREVEFPEEGGQGDPEFSADNPKSCSACHRANLRPSWEQWPRWPEAYFGKDTRADGSEVSVEDRGNIKKFLASSAKAGRYRFLRNLDNYLDEDQQKQGNPANAFNQIILTQVQTMIVEEIRRHPRFERLKYALYAAALGCPGIEDFVPESERGDQSVTFEKIKKDTTLKNAKAGVRLMSLRYLFETYKLPTLHWSPSFRTKHTFRRGADAPDDLNLMPQLNERTGLGTATDPSPEICADLKNKSLGGATGTP